MSEENCTNAPEEELTPGDIKQLKEDKNGQAGGTESQGQESI